SVTSSPSLPEPSSFDPESALSSSFPPQAAKPNATRSKDKANKKFFNFIRIAPYFFQILLQLYLILHKALSQSTYFYFFYVYCFIYMIHIYLYTKYMIIVYIYLYNMYND